MRQFPPALVISALLLSTAVAQPAMEVRLSAPQGVTYNLLDHLFVADTGNNRVLEFDPLLMLVREYGGNAAPQTLDAPMDVAFDHRRGEIYVADYGNDRIVIFNRSGQTARVFTAAGLDDRLQPTNLTIDNDHHCLLVTERPQHRVRVFRLALDGTAELTDTLENRTGARSEEETAAILEYERRRNPNVKADAVGTNWRRQDPNQLNEPGTVFVDNDLGRAYVANGWNGRIEIFAWNGATATLSPLPLEAGRVHGFWVIRGAGVTKSGDLIGVNSAFGGLKRFDQRATLNHASEAAEDIGRGVFGQMQDIRDLAVAPRSGEVALADTHFNRIAIYPADLQLPAHPRVTDITASGAQIRYQTRDTVPTKLQLRTNPYPLDTPEQYVAGGFGEAVERHVGSGRTRTHEIGLDGLAPATRYYYRLHMPEVRGVPFDGWSMEYAINTRGGPGQTAFTRIPVKWLLLANVVNVGSLPRDGDLASLPQPAAMTSAEIETLYADRIREVQEFYWINSRMKYWIDVDFYVDQTWYRTGDAPANAPAWYRELPKLNAGAALQRQIAEAGRENKLYYGQVICTARQDWLDRRDAWIYRGSGGGTYGIDWPQPARTTFLGGSDIAWLFCHEFKHQMESQFGNSGMESEDDRNWFCHYSPAYDDPATRRVEWQWDTAADHGEHWDGIAWQLRHLTRDQYLRNRWGEVASAADADGDGIPDASPELPLDEARLGSSPQRADTDNDGVPDLHELLSSTWVTAMNTATRDRISVPYIRPSLTRQDSDSDGVLDDVDPYPIYPYATTIPRGSITVDGELKDWETAQQITFTHKQLGPANETVAATIQVCYGPEWLYYGIELRSEQQALKLICDADADGFYWGNDNVCVDFGGDGALRDARMHLCNKNRWPYYDTKYEVLAPDDVRAAATQADGVTRIELALPQRDDIGLALEPGERVGLLVYLQMPSGAWVSVFEPYFSFKSTLAPPADVASRE